jgi:hypothetical protein
VASRWRNPGPLVTCLVVAWLALGPLPRMPVLVVADAGFAALGRGAAEVVDALVGVPVLPALAGLVVPVAVPLVLAGRFLRSRYEREAGALCLAWAGTVLTGLAVALAEAAEPGPAGPGSPSDWALLLGRRGLRALDRSADLVSVLRTGATVLLVIAIAVCAVPLVADAVGSGSPPEREAKARAWSGPNRRRI